MGPFNQYLKKTLSEGGEINRRFKTPAQNKNEQRRRIRAYCQEHGITRKQFMKQLRAERRADKARNFARGGAGEPVGEPITPNRTADTSPDAKK